MQLTQQQSQVIIQFQLQIAHKQQEQQEIQEKLNIFMAGVGITGVNIIVDGTVPAPPAETKSASAAEVIAEAAAASAAAQK